MRTRLLLEAICANCYLKHRTQILPQFVENHFFEPMSGAVEIAERKFLDQLIAEDGWTDDGERLLCRRCARKVDKEREGGS